MSKSHAADAKTQEYLDRFMEGVKKRNPGEPEFLQAVYEAAATIFPFIADKPIYHQNQIFEAWPSPSA